MTTVASNTYFACAGVASVRWDVPRGIVLVEWEGAASSEQFGSILDAEVRALREHGGYRLLADCRYQPVLHLADQDRANRDWIPRAAEAGLKKFAIVLPLSDMAAVHLRQRTGEIPPSLFEVAYFTTVEQAVEWLR